MESDVFSKIRVKGDTAYTVYLISPFPILDISTTIRNKY